MTEKEVIVLDSDDEGDVADVSTAAEADKQGQAAAEGSSMGGAASSAAETAETAKASGATATTTTTTTMTATTTTTTTTTTTAGSLAYIGCAGWSYKHWRNGVFFPKGLPQKDEFDYYASVFPAVEINSSFHALPKWSTYESWRERAAALKIPNGHFQHAIKAPKRLTHDQRLRDPEEMVGALWNGAKILRGPDGVPPSGQGPTTALGPLLFQLPPSLPKDMALLRAACDHLPDAGPGSGIRVAWEFRHASWFCEEVYAFLRERNYSLVIVTHPSLPTTIETTAADWVYIRMHGTVELHADSYTDAQLTTWTDEIERMVKSGRDTYMFFNNDINGYAATDGVRLINMLKAKGVPLAPAAPPPKQTTKSITSFFAKKAPAPAAAPAVPAAAVLPPAAAPASPARPAGAAASASNNKTKAPRTPTKSEPSTPKKARITAFFGKK